jgi:hypothetical protein
MGTGPQLTQGQPSAREPHTFLRTHIGFTDAQIRNLEQGKVLTKILETSVKNEVAVFGAVWMDASINEFLRRYRDIENFEKGPGILNTKKINASPRLEDFVDLTFPEEDLDALPECEVGDCEVKVDEPALLRLQKEIDWSAEDAHDRATAQRRSRSALEKYLEMGKQQMEQGSGN